MTLIPLKGEKACTPHPSKSLFRQEGFKRIVFQDVWPCTRSATTTSLISLTSSVTVSCSSAVS